jgi:hypothetical protein
MLRRIAIATVVLCSLAAVPHALAEGGPQYARFQFSHRTATFQSAEKTIAAIEDARSGELAEMYRTISGKEWTTEKEAKGGGLEFAFLNAFAEQGREISQVSYNEGTSVYLLKKLR